MNWSNETDSFPFLDSNNPCPNQRVISRPLLFVHHYSLLFFGSVLNFFAFTILVQKSLRSQSTFAYLAFLSLSNGLLSFVRFSQWMMNYYLDIRFENYLFTCRFYHFTLDFLTHFSLFTLVCVNIDRARAVRKQRPFRRHSKSTFPAVCLKEFTVAIILSIYHFHWLIKFGYEVARGSSKRTICNVDSNRMTPIYAYFLSKIYPVFELTIVFCLPLLINTVCTAIIVRSLQMRSAKDFGFQKRRRRRQTRVHFVDPSNLTRTQRFLSFFRSSLTVEPKTKSSSFTCFSFQIQCQRYTTVGFKLSRTQPKRTRKTEQEIQRTTNETVSVDLQKFDPIAANILNERQRFRRTRDRHLSAMLIVLNILYFLMNLPFNFHQTFSTALYKNTSDDCIMRFTHVLLDLLQQTYFSTNFFLYILTNHRFREEFCTKFRKFSKRNSSIMIESAPCPDQRHRTSCNGDRVHVQNNRESLFTDIEFTETILKSLDRK